jgi:alpha-mannosidase
VLQQRTGRGKRARLLIWADNVPACGYAVYHLVPDRGPRPSNVLSVASDRIETPFHSVRMDRAGRLSRLFDKRAGREVLPAGKRANTFTLFNDLPIEVTSDAWDIDKHYRDVFQVLDGPAEIRVVEKGPVRATIRVKRSFSGSSLEQDIRFYAKSPRIDFETRVDWHEANKLLKVAFPVDLNNPRATYEVQFGHVERPVHENTSWESAKYEVPAQKWANVGEPGFSLSLLNDCKYGYDVADGALRLSLLRATKGSDCEADIGRHAFTYSLWTQAGDFRQGDTVRASYELNAPLHSVTAASHAGSLPSRFCWLETLGENTVVETVKPAEDGKGVICRVYEAFGARGTVRLRFGFGISRAREVDLVERPIRDVTVRGDGIRFTIRPFEIRSFWIEG